MAAQQTAPSGQRITCPGCNGTGRVNPTPPAERRGWTQFGVMCPTCKGWGTVVLR